MATQVQFRRGSTTENNAFTGAVAELTVDTTLYTLRIHDGNTAGGIPIVNTSSAQNVTNKVFGSGNTWQGNPPALAYGGTGASLTAVEGAIVYSTDESFAVSLSGTAGQVLTSGGTAAPIWVTPSSLTVGTAAVATTASNIAGGSAGYLVYQYDTNDTDFIQPGQTGYVLQSTGASTAPQWVTSDLTIGSTSVTLGTTETDFEGLTSLDGTVGLTSLFTTPTGSVSFLTAASAVSIGAGTSTVTVNDDLSVSGNATITGLTTLNGGLTMDSGVFTVADTTGNVHTSGTLDVDGDANFDSNVVVDGYMDFGGMPHPAASPGRLFYDNEHDTLNFYNSASIPVEIGQETLIRVYNNTGATIAAGTPCYATGVHSDGETPTVGLGDASDPGKYNISGIATSAIADSNYGFVTAVGVVHNIDTSSLTAGQRVFLGYASPGTLIQPSPQYPNYPMCIGYVISSDASAGAILVELQNHSVNSFRTVNDLYVGANATVVGNLTVLGTQTISSSANVSIAGALQYLNGGDTIGGNTTFTGSGLNDATLVGQYTGISVKTYYVQIDGEGSPDTFSWSYNSDMSSPEATGVAITGSNQELADGIYISFNATTGHTSGDKWSGSVAPINVDTGWVSNRNNGSYYTHLGMFYDVSASKFKIFDRYDDEPSGTIDVAASNYTAADLEMGDLSTTGITSTGNITASSSTISASTFSGTTGSIGGISMSAGLISYNTGNLVIDASSALYLDSGSGNIILDYNGTSYGGISYAGANTVLLKGGTTTNITLGTTTTSFALPLTLATDLAVEHGGTGSSTAAGAATNLGLGTASDVQHDSLGIGTAASGTSGEIRATNVITAYYSDERLKTFEGNIENALDKVMSLNGYYFRTNDRAKELGYTETHRQVGVSAQEVEAVMPEVVTSAAINNNIPEGEERDYKTVYYDRMVPLLIEAIKEQQKQINELKAKLGE